MFASGLFFWVCVIIAAAILSYVSLAVWLGMDMMWHFMVFIVLTLLLCFVIGGITHLIFNKG